MASLEEIRKERLEKLEKLEKAGRGGWPAKTQATLAVADARERFSALLKQKRALVLAGRIRSLRPQGGLIFLTLDDGTAAIQGLLKKGDSLPIPDFSQFGELVDVGDFLELKGKCFLTKTKEKTLLVEGWRMLAKSLRPLPDKWYGLQEVEERFRRRYLDSLMSPEVKARFIFRSRLISALRQILDRQGFLEVETPTLQPLAGGASAKPFITHHNALDLEFYLRVSDELYLKRLLIGGFPRVYEIYKAFRNEGMDHSHHPEFTMLEFYASMSDLSAERIRVESMFKELATKLTGKKTIIYAGEKIDFSKRFRTVSYFDLLRRQAQIENPEKISLGEVAVRAKQFGLAVAPGDGREKILDAIYKKICRPKLIQPTFVMDYPADYLPLAKRQPDHPNLVEAFQLVIGGLELVKSFSELNDPLDQRARFENQKKIREAGDEEAQPLDEDFLEAMEYGMPPAGGVGIGIDRLAMLFTDTQNIKEVIFFPAMRPRDGR